jgi:hypothetical protein
MNVVLVSNCTNSKLVRASGAAVGFVMSVEGRKGKRGPPRRFASHAAGVPHKADIRAAKIPGGTEQNYPHIYLRGDS